MAVLTVYPNGMKAGIAPGKSDHQRAKRDKVGGWSEKSTRANLEFLKSVLIPRLDGLGHAFTLTVRTCPESPEKWASMRDRYIKRLVRGGCIRLHWVTEWQKRGVPHLHGVAFFPAPESDREYMLQSRLVRHAWLAVVQDETVEDHSQHVNPMESALGWLQYLAKHASRGAAHYQRSKESMPLAWDGVTGRMWGKAGNWPVQAGTRLELSQSAFFAFRRWVRGWRRADARCASGVLSERQEAVRRARIRSARGMLRCNLESLSQTRGVSEWIPEAVQWSMVEYLNRYHEVRC